MPLYAAENEEEREYEADEAKHCDICEMWLNGPAEMVDHKIGKKHKQLLKLTPAERTQTRNKRNRVRRRTGETGELIEAQPY